MPESSAAALADTNSNTSGVYAGKTGYAWISLAAVEATTFCAATSCVMNGFEASRPCATISSLGLTAPARMKLASSSLALWP